MLLERVNQFLASTHRLSGLRDDPKGRPRLQHSNVLKAQNHVRVGEITNQSQDLGVVPLSDDQRMESLSHQSRERLVGDVDQGAGGIEETMPLRSDLGTSLVARTVGRDHDGVGGRGFQIWFESRPQRTQVIEDCRVVYEVPQDGKRPVQRFVTGEFDGIADAEAHAQMVCTKKIHNIRVSRDD